MPAVEYRPASLDDLADILSLNQQPFNFETVHSDQYNTDWTNSEVGTTYFTRRLTNSNSRVFLALSNNQVVGYLCAHVDTYAFRKPSRICELENMFVLESFRTQGIGSQLVALVKEWCKVQDVKRIKVGFLTSNRAAQEFYQAAGFLPHEEIWEQSLI